MLGIESLPENLSGRIPPSLYLPEIQAVNKKPQIEEKERSRPYVSGDVRMRLCYSNEVLQNTSR